MVIITKPKSNRLLTLSENNPIPRSNWYVIRTKPHCERKVGNLLTRKRIKNYCPLHQVEGDWLDWKKIVIKPLFPSFVFVYIKEENLAYVRHTAGIMNFVYWLSEPVIISAGEINTIRVILKEYENVNLEKAAVKKEYMGIMAETLLLLEKNSLTNNAVRIILPSLGYYLIAEFRKGRIAMTK